jgi:hypothetical protein
MMNIVVTYNFIKETLLNLRLPPNRKTGQQGFVSYTTDRQLSKNIPQCYSPAREFLSEPAH